MRASNLQMTIAKSAATLVALLFGAAQLNATTYTTPGTWSYTVPANVYAVTVTLNGAGGGGGGADAGGSGGNGGSGGSIIVTFNVTPGQTVSGIVGGGGTGFTGGTGFSTACVGGGVASAYGGGGSGANANCGTAGGYSGGGGAGGGASTVSYGGTVIAQAGGGGGGSGGGWNNNAVSGVSVPNTITKTASCSTLGTGTAGVALNLDGGAAGGGGGGIPGGTAGAGSGDDGGATGTVGATNGGAKAGGGAGGTCYSTSGVIISAAANGAGAAGAAGASGTIGASSTAGPSGSNGSVTIVPYTSLSFTKVSSVISDPINGTTNPKAIPGAIIKYCITVTNSGPSSIGSVTITDPLPSNITFVSNTLYSGTSCGSASTLLSNPSPATTINVPVGSLASGINAAIVFNATIN